MPQEPHPCQRGQRPDHASQPLRSRVWLLRHPRQHDDRASLLTHTQARRAASQAVRCVFGVRAIVAAPRAGGTQAAVGRIRHPHCREVGQVRARAPPTQHTRPFLPWQRRDAAEHHSAARPAGSSMSTNGLSSRSAPMRVRSGMATFTHTPAGRGFESWLGYFGHCNDYWRVSTAPALVRATAPGCGWTRSVPRWLRPASAL